MPSDILPFRRTIKIGIKTLSATAKAPVYSSDEAAGADLCADLEGAYILPVGQRKLIPINISLEIPTGYEGQVRPRSGLALKHGITVLNSPGTIDSDYRGPIGVILYNAGSEDFEIKPGDRIAQLVIARHEQGEFLFTGGELSETKRAHGGFGSTGTGGEAA